MNPVLYSDKSASQIVLSAFATLLCRLNNLLISFGIGAQAMIRQLIRRWLGQFGYLLLGKVFTGYLWTALFQVR